MKRNLAVAVFVVGLALTSVNAHAAYGVGVALPIIGEADGQAIEGNPLMVITAGVVQEDGSLRALEFDAISAVPADSLIMTKVALQNLTIRPEADATLGVQLGVTGYTSYEEWLARVAEQKPYEQSSRKELRRAKPAVYISNPARWVPATRDSVVEYPKQRRGQNGPLSFTGYIEARDLIPGFINVITVRVHGIMEQRTTPFLVLGKHGKSIFGTYDEPWLVMVEPRVECPETKDDCADPKPEYVTREEFLRKMEEFRTSIITEVKAAISGALDKIATNEPEPTPQVLPQEPAPIETTPPAEEPEPENVTTLRFQAEKQIIRVVVEGNLPPNAMFWWSVDNGEWHEVAPSQMSRNGDWATFRLNLKGYSGRVIAAAVTVGEEYLVYKEYQLGGGH